MTQAIYESAPGVSALYREHEYIIGLTPTVGGAFPDVVDYPVVITEFPNKTIIYNFPAIDLVLAAPTQVTSITPLPDRFTPTLHYRHATSTNDGRLCEIRIASNGLIGVSTIDLVNGTYEEDFAAGNLLIQSNCVVTKEEL